MAAAGRAGSRGSRSRGTAAASTFGPRPATRSTVNPNRSKIVPAGADAPKWSRPTIALRRRPSAPSPGSRRPRPTRARTVLAGHGFAVGGLLRLEQLPAGQLDDPGRDAVAFSASAARNASCSSDPVPIRIDPRLAPASPRAGRSPARHALACRAGRTRRGRQLLPGQRQRHRRPRDRCDARSPSPRPRPSRSRRRAG